VAASEQGLQDLARMQRRIFIARVWLSLLRDRA
jgi:hypothetical protein